MVRRKSILDVAGMGIAATLAGWAAGAAAQSNATRPPIEYPPTAVVVGQGWDSQSVMSKNAVCITQYHVIPSQEGQGITAQMKSITDQTTLSNALDISADVQVKSIAGDSAGAKASFAQSQKIDNNFISVAHLVQVANGAQTAVPIPAEQAQRVATALRSQPGRTSAEVARQLNISPAAVQQQHAPFYELMRRARNPSEKSRAQALALAYINHAYATGTPLAQAPKPTSLNAPIPQLPRRAGLRDAPPAGAIVLLDEYAQLSQTNPDKFRSICGDSFVQAVNQGGELSIRYTFQTRSIEDQTTISAAVNGSASYAGVEVSANASFQNQAKSYSSNGQLFIDSVILGGVGLTAPKDLDSVNSVVSGFSAAVATNPHNYSIVITDYKSLANYGGDPMAPLTNVERLAWEFGKASSLFNTVTAILNDVDAQSNAQAGGTYVQTRWRGSKDRLASLQSQLQGRLGQLTNQAKSCRASGSADSDACLPKEMLDDLAPRAEFPLPMQPGKAADMLNAVFGDEQVYSGLVYQFWIASPNLQRCSANPDPQYCRLESDIAKLQQNIPASKPAVATFSVMGQNNRCWTAYNDYGRMGVQPCPLNLASTVANQKFVAIPRNDGTLQLLTTVPGIGQQCVSALQDQWNDKWIAAVDCNKPRAGATAIGQTWALAPSPDGSSFQVVSTDASFNNLCARMNDNSTGLANCGDTSAARFVIGQTFAQ